MNVQYAIKDDAIYVLEVNPRASRTVPFVAKATGVPVAKIGARVMAGAKLASFKLDDADRAARGGQGGGVPVRPLPECGHHPGAGDEIHRRGDGAGHSFERAFAKAQLGAGVKLPLAGTAFLSVKEADKAAIVPIARRLAELGFAILATKGTAARIAKAGIAVKSVNKVLEGRPHCVDAIRSGEIQLVINTAHGPQSVADSFDIRRYALTQGVPSFSTIAAARATAHAIAALISGSLEVAPLQSYFPQPF